ncbi:DENN domain-containing protein 1B-like [Zeugodacus cucurbitae]|uniref:DENN domain-containing protein 1B-like n=1 Tax=Zeugodacus cucurbitae TaxID=28588 RepID=UPI0023D91C0A|nr:DENN domain-containing protein 1B-like [Zeugodacus cucurbitae]
MSNNLAGIPGTRVHVDVNSLFDVYCELNCPVNRTENHANQNVNSITEKFPTNFRDDNLLKMLQLFASTPCENEGVPVGMYSFVLTAEDSHWRFCFCRYDLDTNSIMIILTRLPWHETFFNMMITLAELKQRNANDFHVFLSNCYKAAVPPRGEVTLVAVGGTSRKMLSFEQPSFYKLPCIPGNHNLTVFYNFATPKVMLAIIASLMLERRVIITSQQPDRHSACVQAANALLYPMEWQHTYIPILPMQLRDYLMGPMPYLIGAPISVLDTVCRGELGDAIIFNCDVGTYESCYNDVQQLPQSIVKDMQDEFRHSKQHNGELISYVFLLMMVRLVGKYRDGIKFESDPFFCENAFLSKCPQTKHKFLRQFLSTSMCVHFLRTRLSMLKHGPMLWDRFEMESAMHTQPKKNGCCGGAKKKKFKETDEIYEPLNSFQNQLFKSLEITETIKMQLEDLRKSQQYKDAKTHADMKELFGSLRYTLSYATSAYNSLEAQNVEEMKNLGYTEINASTFKNDSVQEKGGSSKPRYNG